MKRLDRLETRVPRGFCVCCMIATALMSCSIRSAAQRHGGTSGGTSMWSYSRPDGVAEKDTLQDFHHVLEVQASSPQVTEFQELSKITEDAKSALQTILTAGDFSSESTQALSQKLDVARGRTKNFVAGLSELQKAGLKDLIRRIEKADSDLAEEQARLSQSVESKAADFSLRAQALNKSLTDFAGEQLALGREMSIVVASGQDLSFHLPTVRTPVRLAGKNVTVIVSGALSQVSIEEAQRSFRLEVYEDQSDLQQDVDALSRTLLNSSNDCGERIAVRRAFLTPAIPSAILILELHYERWSCSRLLGSSGTTELAESDGAVQLKLTPSFDRSNGLKLTAELGSMKAEGMFAEALRSGDLGDDLRTKIAQAFLPAPQAGTNFKSNLPPVLQNAVAMQTARFTDVGAGVLAVVLEGQTQISKEQADMLAAQLNQTLGQKPVNAQ